MKLSRTASTAIRTYLAAFTPRATRLLAVGLIPIFLGLGFILLAHYAPIGATYGRPWLVRAYAVWVDSIGASILLLAGGAALLDHTERSEGQSTE